MVKVEAHLISALKGHGQCWKHYIDDTICSFKTEWTSHVLTILNKFHPSIKMTYKTESDNKISFLDVKGKTSRC